jgi:guanine deaminase
MLKVFRGEMLHFLANPAKHSDSESYQHLNDGILVVKDGKVADFGAADELLATLPAGVEINHYKNGLIMPGFVDTHVHYPQIDMMAAYGEQLLQWLENYTYPAERRFSDVAYATEMAEFFLQQLLAVGTTTALVFGTVHKASVDAFFTVAQRKKLRMICGKVLMDQNCPDDLQDTAESGYADSKALINQWHGKDRLQYAITPRFAPTCSQAQLDKAGELLAEYPGVYMHTHLCESKQEIAWVKELFPQRKDYLDVYQHSGLVGRRSIFAHGVHLSDDECQRLGHSDAAIAFCPCSHLFLGSGLFDLAQANRFDVNVGIGSDVGAGTSLSLLQNLNEGYKVQQLRGDTLTPFQGFYHATLGGAVALDLEQSIGNFIPGKEADFVVLDYHGTEMMQRRINNCHSLSEKLFVLSMLADERHIRATHILGEAVTNTVTKE